MRYFSLTKINRINELRLPKVFLLVALFLLISVRSLGQPTADFSVSSTTVCSGLSVVFTDNSSNITGAPSYSWNFGVGSSPSTVTGVGPHTVTYSESGTVTVSLTVTDDNGPNTKTKTNYITVNTLPVAAGTITGNATVCQGETGVAYSVPSISGATGYSWVYSGTGATINGTTNAVTIDFASNATTGNLTVYGTNSCGNGTISLAHSITVSSLPVAAGTITGNATVCQGQTGVTYSVAAITGATGYTWSLPTGASITAGTNTNNITVSYSTSAVSGNITVRGTNGCGNGTVSANYVVTVNSLPTITGTLSVCLGSTTQLSGSGTPAVTNPWVSATPGVATVSSSGLVISVSAGTSVITYTNNNGCSITATVTVTLCFKTLNLTSVMLQGLYNGGGTMRQAFDEFGTAHWHDGSADHITVELHSAIDYTTIVFTATDVPLSTNGTASVTTIPANLNGSYYITIRHRNSIETTTAVTIPFAGSIINQSFGNPSFIYGSNLGVSFDGHYLIYGGDVNQDGAVDSGDYPPVVNDNFNYVSGYLATDIDGNGSIDSGDYPIMVNNNFNYIGTAHP